MALSLLCQRPLPPVCAVSGCIPIALDCVTSFGKWIAGQVVLYWHQKVSRMPQYQEESTAIPTSCFLLMENLAMALRPFVHPIYHESRP